MLCQEGTNMSKAVQARLVESGAGRVVLHLAAMLRDGRLLWHLKGVARELSI